MSQQDSETTAAPASLSSHTPDEMFRTLVENLPIGVYRATPDGRILYGNPAWVRIMGYGSLAEMQTLGLEAIAAANGYPRDFFRERIEQRDEIVGLETAWTRRDGRHIVVRENVRVVRAPQGNVLYLDSTMEDITDDRQAKDTLAKANVALTDAVRARDEMIQNVSHELRTPLTHIMGYGELLASGVVGGPLNADHLAAVNTIRQRAESLAQMVNTLLTLHSLTPERLEKETIEIELLIAATLANWQQRADERGIALRQSVPRGLTAIYGDYNRLQEALDQLMDNAFKFTDPGGAIAIAAEQRGAEIWLVISDTGIGIPPAQLERVFDRFFQVDASITRRRKGTGIGLALVRQIVEMHGGRIWAESDGVPGHGTTMRMALPIAH